jgi:hypothetical protein
MNVLVTASRLPVALDIIRKLGARGHRVIAADTFRTAPGGFSRYAAARVLVAPPETQPRRFVRDVQALVVARAIDLIVPCFEEVFYLARHAAELAELVHVFAPPFALLARLHHKASFNALARAVGVAAPDTTLARDDAELAAAARAYGHYVARPAWSRGGLDIATNAGPLAGAVPLGRCHPTARQPWIVQEYVGGHDVCTFTIARRGRVVAHCAYIHPIEIEHAGGIVFESIDDPAALRATQAIVAATGYHGQLGLDFRRDGRKLWAVECNPRPTAGVHLMPASMWTEAVLDGPSHVRVVLPGRRRMYASALVRDLLRHREHAREDLGYLFSRIRDVYAEPGDARPALMQLLAFLRVVTYRLRHPAPLRHGTTLVAAILDGIRWDGEPIP